MQRRNFLALPFVAAIAGVAKACLGRGTPEAVDVSGPIRGRTASLLIIDDPYTAVTAGTAAWWDSKTGQCVIGEGPNQHHFDCVRYTHAGLLFKQV